VTAAERGDALEWSVLVDELDDSGIALTPPVLTTDECAAVSDLYFDDTRFRSTVNMAQHRFGAGEYRYFDHPLPEIVVALREAFWRRLLPVARSWAERRDQPAPWPDSFADWLEQCHAAGQRRPTPLMLSYGPGDWNALHRDLYGELVFPLQVVIALNEPEVDYTGGEFVVVEQRPRAQSRATSMTIPRGHGLVFTTRDRPVRTRNGWANAPMRHSVSTVRSGARRTVGLIFHDAE
jgi:hypothetical protein